MSRKPREGKSDELAGGEPGPPGAADNPPAEGELPAAQEQGAADAGEVAEAEDQPAVAAAGDDEPDDDAGVHEPGDDADADEPGDEPGEVLAPPAAETGLAAAPPPNAFLKGAVIGLILLIPLTALAVYVLGRLDIGDPQASYYSVIAFVAVFAGLPAIITAGGIGRAAAGALVRPGDRGGPSASTRVSTLYAALTTVGLVLLSVVPLGAVPTAVGTWIWIIALGGLTGALGGFVLGLWVGYGSRKQASIDL